ncbi:MAG: DUF6884 domain-containing protein [Chitinophagales bacterium]
MKIYCTTCCKEKINTTEKVAAIDLYISGRINAIYKWSKKDKIAFRILSGKYGLLRPETKIEWYDKRLKMEDMPQIVPIIAEHLSETKIDEVVFFAKELNDFPDWKPYYKAIEKACSLKNILLNIRIIP